jgi:hypothetical protein
MKTLGEYRVEDMASEQDPYFLTSAERDRIIPRLARPLPNRTTSSSSTFRSQMFP